MTDQAEIERWIRDELNRGYDSETIKLQLKQNGYAPNLINGLVDQIANENYANSQAGFQNNTPNSSDNTGANPQMQYGMRNNPVNPNSSSAQSNVNRNLGTQNPTYSSQGNSQASNAQTAQFRNMGFIEKAKMVLLNPKEFFNIMPVTGGYKDPIIFFSTIMIISLIINSILGIIFANAKLGHLAVNTILLLVLFIPVFFIVALIYHTLLKIVGGNGSYESTFRVIAYSSAPSLFSWIPLVGLITGIYQLYINLVGYSKVHNISDTKALIVLLIPIIIFSIIIIIVIVVVGLSIFSNFGGIETPTGEIISYFSSGY